LLGLIPSVPPGQLSLCILSVKAFFSHLQSPIFNPLDRLNTEDLLLYSYISFGSCLSNPTCAIWSSRSAVFILNTRRLIKHSFNHFRTLPPEILTEGRASITLWRFEMLDRCRVAGFDGSRGSFMLSSLEGFEGAMVTAVDGGKSLRWVWW
jgi:hypothetical protein